MRHLLPVLVALLVAVTAPVVAVAGALDRQIVRQNHYYGVGWQADGNHWSIDVVLTPGGAQIAYPSLGCTGSWKLIAATDQELTYAESITDGQRDCIATGVVRLRLLPAGRFLYSWQETDARIDARAVLLPTGKARMPYIQQLVETLNNVPLDYLEAPFYE